MNEKEIAVYKEQLLKSCRDFADFEQLADGTHAYYVKDVGYLCAMDLRIIADELDRLNGKGGAS